MERPQQQQQTRVKETNTTTGERCVFTTTQENLAKSLRVVGGVVGKNLSLPILSHVLIKTDQGQLRLSTTDLEVGVTAWIAGRLRGTGAITVPFRTLAEYVQHIPSGPVELTLERGSLTLSAQGSEPARREGAHAVMQGDTAENFPLIPSLEEGMDITVPSPLLVESLERVLYALATEDTRPELAGLFLRGEQSTLILAATDSYRLAEARLTLPASVPNPVSVIIPGRAAQEIRRVLEGVEEATLRVGENQFLILTPTAHIVSRRVEGTYPDYTHIIPAKTPITLDLDRRELLRSIRAASAFSEGTVSRLTLEVGSDHLRVTAVTPELGETTHTLAADVSGDGVTIAFNARFLREALTALPADRVRLGLGSATTPAMVRPLLDEKRPDGPSDALSVLALVMPIKS